MQKRYEERKAREAHCKTADDSGVQQLAPKSKVRQTGGIMGPSFGETRDEIREVRMEQFAGELPVELEGALNP
jgi:hypothetical protein